MAKRRIMHTMPHDSPGTLVFWCWKSQQNSNGVTPNWGTKCRWGMLNAGAVAANCRLLTWINCQLGSVASLSHWASTLFFCSTFAVIQRTVRVCQRQLILGFYSVPFPEVSSWVTKGWTAVIFPRSLQCFDIVVWVKQTCSYSQRCWSNSTIEGRVNRNLESCSRFLSCCM